MEVQSPIDIGPPDVVYCEECGETAHRIYTSPVVHYHCQGFHSTDYDSKGDKLEQLGKAYQKEYGEALPKPSKDVPVNSGDPF